MHKIDSDGSTPNREFTSGDIVKKIPATVISADWLNTMQAEVANVVGDENLDKNNNAQLKGIIDAIKNDIETIKDTYLHRGDVGKINIRVCNKTNLEDVSANEIEANGALLKREDYPDLWRYAVSSRRILSEASWNDAQKPDNKLQFSAGDGKTTFRIPLITPAEIK